MGRVEAKMHVFHHRVIENQYNFFAMGVFYNNLSEVVSTKNITGRWKNTTSLILINLKKNRTGSWFERSCIAKNPHGLMVFAH